MEGGKKVKETNVLSVVTRLTEQATLMKPTSFHDYAMVLKDIFFNDIN